MLGTVRRSAVLNTRHSVRSVPHPGRSVVVYEVARGFSDGQEFATSINVANEGSVTGVTELGVQPASRIGPRAYKEIHIFNTLERLENLSARAFILKCRNGALYAVSLSAP